MARPTFLGASLGIFSWQILKYGVRKQAGQISLCEFVIINAKLQEVEGGLPLLEKKKKKSAQGGVKQMCAYWRLSS